jgi:manganese efflux pump family protein
MDVAALVTWLVTAVGGFVLLGLWIARGALRAPAGEGTRFPPAAVFGHLLLAAAGLVVWIVFVASSSSSGLAWAALVILVPVALLGFAMLLRWLAGRRQLSRAPASVGAAAAPTVAPAEQSFPVAIVVLHGVLAVTTVVLVLIAALQAT